MLPDYELRVSEKNKCAGLCRIEPDVGSYARRIRQCILVDMCWRMQRSRRAKGQARRLSENALFPKLCVMLKKLSSEYQPYACGNFFRMP